MQNRVQKLESEIKDYNLDINETLRLLEILRRDLDAKKTKS